MLQVDSRYVKTECQTSARSITRSILKLPYISYEMRVSYEILQRKFRCIYRDIYRESFIINDIRRVYDGKLKITFEA